MNKFESPNLDVDLSEATTEIRSVESEQQEGSSEYPIVDFEKEHREQLVEINRQIDEAKQGLNDLMEYFKPELAAPIDPENPHEIPSHVDALLKSQAAAIHGLETAKRQLQIVVAQAEMQASAKYYQDQAEQGDPQSRDIAEWIRGLNDRVEILAEENVSLGEAVFIGNEDLAIRETRQTGPTGPIAKQEFPSQLLPNKGREQPKEDLFSREALRKDLMQLRLDSLDPEWKSTSGDQTVLEYSSAGQEAYFSEHNMRFRENLMTRYKAEQPKTQVVDTYGRGSRENFQEGTLTRQSVYDDLAAAYRANRQEREAA